jgi:hypothetical protein
VRRRRTFTKVVSERAYCEGCSWKDSGPGAQGRAAQHSDKTGHTTKWWRDLQGIYTHLQ